MKSGILHLRKKMGDEGEETHRDPSPPAIIADEIAEKTPISGCELDEPRWSVVSFDQMEAGGLTYSQASRLMAELESHNVAGLCIVTDQAAERMTS